MKIMISTINSKFIHLNNSVYIIQMYLNTNSTIKTYTIKETDEYIANDLISHNCDIYFFSVYIWNIEKYKNIIKIIKKALPTCKIVVGGPEVSYDFKYLLDIVDIVYRGEVNESINEITDNNIISNHIVSNKEQNYVCNYNSFVHKFDYIFNNKIDKNQILYIETSKGCPYKCSYCMSSLEKNVVNAPIEEVYKLIDYAVSSGVSTIKFLDRTFNVDAKRVRNILEYILKVSSNYQSFQFEVTAELINEDLLGYLKTIDTNQIRFEIGIQSIHSKTIKAVDRVQMYEKYENTIKAICNETNIITHIDLIAGLPYETLPKFIESFNRTIRLNPDEYQLGILKVLNGTKIKSETNLHQINYENVAPYQFISNKYLSEDDVNLILRIENIVDRFYNTNKFRNTFKKLLEDHSNIFELLLQFDQYLIENNVKLIDYQLVDIYSWLYNFLEINYNNLKDYVIYDYLTIIKSKPKRFYPTISKQELNKVLTALVDETYSLNYLYKYVIVEKLQLNNTTYVIKDIKKNTINYLIK